MTPEERRLLNEVAALTQENNKILKKMQRARRWAHLFGLIRWLVIITLAVAGYYYFQPYLEQLQNIYRSLQTGLEDVKKAGNSLPSFQELLDSFKGFIQNSPGPTSSGPR